MASSIFLASHILSLILFPLLLGTQPTYSVPVPSSGLRAALTRIGSGKTLPMKASNDVYIMSLAIGTPPVPFSAIMDTGSDLIWTKCKPSGKGLFDPSKSKSFTKVKRSCDSLRLPGCKQKYQDKKSVSLVVGQETLTVDKEKVANVTFACGTPHPDKQFEYDEIVGIVGMGHGELSLVSQLKESVFSYCLGSRFGKKTNSVLLTGSKASSKNIGTQTMPLFKQDNKPYYYISLEGISVGDTKLAVTKSDFAISNGSGGMIIDSGTTFTYLEESIVESISNEFMKQTKLTKSENHNGKYYKGELTHCFKSPRDGPLPKLNMVFHFEGADWELLPQNYIYKLDGQNLACLAFIANDPKDQDNVSVFGNMQQQDMLVIYDLQKDSLSFRHADCNQL